jgi:hypothetical protein
VPSIAVTTRVELLFIMISMAQGTFYVIGEGDSEREMTLSILPFKKLVGLEVTPSCKKMVNGSSSFI